MDSNFNQEFIRRYEILQNKYDELMKQLTHTVALLGNLRDALKELNTEVDGNRENARKELHDKEQELRNVINQINKELSDNIGSIRDGLGSVTSGMRDKIEEVCKDRRLELKFDINKTIDENNKATKEKIDSIANEQKQTREKVESLDKLALTLKVKLTMYGTIGGAAASAAVLILKDYILK